MKNECSIVQDILPLYVEDMVSEDTAGFAFKRLPGVPCRIEKTAGAGDSSTGAGYQRRTAETAEKDVIDEKNADHLMHGCRTAGTAAVRHFASYRTGIF